ncbi:radical SAM/SPASM domain-containing protein [Vallitalea guaymasensis]|uniref:Radical SAM protein n=1 Tax=Vallitalea guaymasensis TaxID=1185412 RepID=A0A8J8SCM8_9FIRM|nr:radical SAM protein [Vallitalea guaymasensis]QUH29902.1 radical SAM protein [Vallitalea guaymasensis]
MKNNENICKFIEVETDNAIYNFGFSDIQFEITGKCNMFCEHCRGAFEKRVDLPVEQIYKVIKFAKIYSSDLKEVMLSGGEPFMHKNFREVLKCVSDLKIPNLTLTTNGSFLNSNIIDYIKSLNFERVIFSISLDSLDAKKHNAFRHHNKAYEYAISALKKLAEYKEPSFFVSIRSTILPGNINEMEDMVKFGIELGVDRVSFSSVLPSGKALEKPELWMDVKKLKEFSTNLHRLNNKYCNVIDVSSNEVLKWISNGDHYNKEEGVVTIEGCAAGTLSFNINSNGDMTPCALLGLPMFNILNKTIEEIEKAFIHNSIVHNLLDRNLKGSCGSCNEKNRCGGCRARAHYVNGDYLAEDPNCWKN